MLVLSRRRGELIVINPGSPDEITITVVDARGDQIRIGIEAPRHMQVHRREVAERIARGEPQKGGA